MTTTKKHVLIIIMSNILSHGLLLIVTGTFWDDWFYYYRDRVGLWKEFMELGRPSSAYWVEAVWNIPHYGYRWLVFLVFTLTALILYIIIRNFGMFTAKEALWLSVLYSVIPVNDARIILCTFSYGVGLASFLAGAYILQKYMQDRENNRFRFRIAALLLLGYSFIIQSLLVFYVVVLLCIIYYEYQNRRKILETIKAMIKYADFILLPISFWIGKQILFPAYGSSADYNAVTMGAVVKAAFRLPLAVIKQAERNWIGIFDFAIPGNAVVVCTIFVVLYVFIQIGIWLRGQISHGISILTCIGVGGGQNNDLPKLLLGIFLFALGLYPYNVVRGADEVLIVGVESRDSLLLAPGMAIMLYYFFKLLFRNIKARRMIYGILILCCCISCNCHYLNYQRDAYWQEALISKLRINEEVREVHNLLFFSDDVNGTNGTRFYTLNGAASVAFGDQTRLILTEGSYQLLRDSEEKKRCVNSRRMLMNEYNIFNDKLDGVIVYNCDISYKECILLKLQELVDTEKYWEQIEKMGELNYYPADSREAEELIDGMGIL